MIGLRLRLETRQDPSPVWTFLSPLAALAVTVVFASVMFVSLGKDPIQALQVFLLGPFTSASQVGELALKATPLVLCSLGLALCFRGNIWNIGAEGQYLFGAIGGGGVAMWATTHELPVAPWAFFPVAVLAGALAGAAWAAVVAWLKDRFHANEIFVSLMLVYVASHFLYWLVFGPWKDPKGHNFPQTVSFSYDTKIPVFFHGIRVNWGFALALAVAVVLWFFLHRTFKGLQLQIGGPAPAAARYAGFSARSVLWSTLLVSGGLCGVAGALETVGPNGQLTQHAAVGYGFTAIVVAFVGRLDPLGCVVASFVLSTFLVGGEMAQVRVGMPAALTGVFQGVLLLALLSFDAFIQHRLRASGGARAARAEARPA